MRRATPPDGPLEPYAALPASEAATRGGRDDGPLPYTRSAAVPGELAGESGSRGPPGPIHGVLPNPVPLHTQGGG